MVPEINIETLRTAVLADNELAYKMRGLSAVIRVQVGSQSLDFEFSPSGLKVRQAEGDAAVTLAAGEDFWAQALASSTPAPGFETLTMAGTRGLTVDGDFAGIITAYQGGLQRLYRVLVESVTGPTRRSAPAEPFRGTDNAVGRYVYVTANGVEARVYYEEAGHGPIPLMLGATAGADSRQYRHLLADPDMQARFTMYAYDLPYHGRSLPPIGERWWEKPYLPTGEYLMNWVVGIADALGLDQPFFMGCSVGGQLALDLAAEHGDRFGAFVSLNGWYDVPAMPEGFSNDLFRTPNLSSDYAPSLNFGAAGPLAPEANAQEVYWVYRSSFPGIYAGDNDYFAYGHDLKINGHKIDAVNKPVYVIAGEYDPAAHDTVHGGAAVAENIPGSVFVVSPGLSHFAMQDDPIAFRESLLPVLDQVIEQANTPAAPLESEAAK
ncbi:alpha/beta fold hydrolase [Arthrobacter sp. W4I7]|uniref:alpha/beta fold hydrolase n=1 Tax=Arthrobacter sp. W4I7 TaxID=3042296 RepID=UPI00277DD991|nr:alpha/beta hydrolase [Arthrobacter sp. W4I7]MDQ0691436.1 pimeloyl-ACP methyl ester carboxylesterase [Arthrobacter sp. W4I7]